jgi:hypothetical protein
MDMGEITSIAEHLSITERTAADAEIDAAQMKKLEFFQRQLDERNPQIFRAAIVDVQLRVDGGTAGCHDYWACPRLLTDGRFLFV